mmetsp:Transcript_26929/g.71466  ORF Transcript_26929/g.71466 Transcript_26929/m.71466 type:complete len:220 (-) Transcript_26929:868-1527(-)
MARIAKSAVVRGTMCTLEASRAGGSTALVTAPLQTGARPPQCTSAAARAEPRYARLGKIALCGAVMQRELSGCQHGFQVKDSEFKRVRLARLTYRIVDLRCCCESDLWASFQAPKRLCECKHTCRCARDECVHAEANHFLAGLLCKLPHMVLNGPGVLSCVKVLREHQREVIGLHAIWQAQCAGSALGVHDVIRDIIIDKVEESLNARLRRNLWCPLSH